MQLLMTSIVMHNCRNISRAYSQIKYLLKSGTRHYSTSHQGYCLDLVRKYDYENYLCSLLLSQQIRCTSFAVRGFNVEVSRVQDQVSEFRLAQMRLQFWLDTLDKLFKDIVPEHPVAQELHKAIKLHKLQKHHLRSLVLARTSQLSNAPFSTIQAVESYAEATASPILYLLLQAVGVKNVHADHAASHLGKAQGVAMLVRSLPHNCARRVVTLPSDVLLQHNVSQETVLRGQRDQSVRDVVFDVASRAKQHLDKARRMKDKVPKEAYILFLPAIATSWYLDKLQEVAFDVFHPKLQRRNPRLPWNLYWNKLTKQY